MAKHGKKFTAAAAQVGERQYTIEEAIPLLQKVKYAKFDETVEVAMRLGVDPKHADQMVRGTVVLPHGLGKSKKVLAIAAPTSRRKRRTRAPTSSAATMLSRRFSAAGWTSTRSSRRQT